MAQRILCTLVQLINFRSHCASFGGAGIQINKGFQRESLLLFYTFFYSFFLCNFLQLFFMFYSPQLHGPKAPLQQIWIAGTMNEKINKKKLNKLDIIDICEKIQNPAIPMAPRLSGILMGGVLNVFQTKVDMLYDDVSRLLVKIDEALEEVKSDPIPTMLPKGKSQAKSVAITLLDKEQMPFEMEQYHQSNATTTMRLDDVEEPNFSNGGSDEEDLGNDHHQGKEDFEDDLFG